ncbi:MAG TPA: LLM class F420-dependent oxidoreductase [Acidimicrobiales bacterium]|jgi:F420-dependent oxidoreductase-like protein|nr:LLM class F420-dependent oxidoreductase [Acidimicrobiales bacterium]
MLLRIFIEPQQGASYEQQLAVARVAEEEGFDAFFRSDHYLRMGPGDGLPGPTDSWVTLGALARETSRIRLGTMVTSVTFRLPGPLAIAVAQVDQMSGGRVDLGIGAGWFEEEHTAYGIPFGTFSQRFELLEETLEVLTGMWDTPAGERFNYAGRRIAMVDSPALPKPAQRPRPPIILGGAGKEKTPRLAARFADEFNTPFHSLEAASAQFGRVRAACEAAGRDPSTMILSSALAVCVGSDEAEVQRRAAAIGRAPEHIDLAGSPEQVAERLRGFAEAGATRAYLQVLDLDDLDHLRLIAAEVAPLLA